MWWQWLTFLAMAAVIFFSFWLPAPQQQIGEASRIFYYHIPSAWLAVVAFGTSMVYSIMYLRRKNPDFDDRAAIANALGLIFAILATVTGAVFAKVTWGTFWNWDPRQTSIFVLLLIYGAYFSLRGAIEVEEKKANLSAVYSIFAVPPAVFLVFIFPRLTPSLHPSDTVLGKDLEWNLVHPYGTIFIASMVLFTILYIWMFWIAARTYKLQRLQQEEED